MNRFHYFFILTLTTASLFLSACGMTGRVAKESTEVQKSAGKVLEDGMASWYGPNFHGKLTANGEIYDMETLTAAHRTLPFETVVEVVNQQNGKSVVVRINDRGPFAKDRIIDLSRRAASRIDMIGPGTAPVKLYLVKGELENSRTTNLKVATYTVQLASFRQQYQADEYARKINGTRVEKIQSPGQDAVYRVYYGTYEDPREAEKAMDRLAKDGFSGYVKQIQN